MWTTVRAWEGSARPGRCRDCRRAIVWVYTDEGKSMPFNLGFTVREIVTHPETRARFVVLSKDDRHDCSEGRIARKDLAGRGASKVLTPDRKWGKT